MQKRVLNESWLGELKSKNDIVTVISSYIQLKKRGRNYWGSCPFHHEKTPSFCVNQDEQFFHCFGCKEGGDVVSFIRKIENCDYMDAIRLLADKVGMTVPSTKNIDDETIQKRKREKERVLELLDKTMKHYQENLLKPVSKPAQDYIKFRRVGGRALKEYMLGYSINWNELVNYLRGEKFTVEEMKQAGVVQEKDGQVYDFYGGRLIFPVFNNFCECVGFSGRVLGKSDFAKYKNSSQTIVFDKSKLLYGMQVIKKLKKEGKLDNIIIVEGQLDVIAMFKGGFENCIACLGTALTENHAQMIKRLADEVLLCFDGDTAGIKATFRSIEILAKEGIKTKVIAMPPKTDPDEFLAQYGSEEMQKKIDEALPAIDFMITYYANNSDMKDNQSRSAFVKSALEVISKINTESEKQVYLELTKNLSGVPIDILRRDLENNSFSQNNETVQEPEIEESAVNKHIKFVLASLLFKKEYANYNFNLIEHLKNPIYIDLYNYLKQHHDSDSAVRVSNLYDVFDVENEPNLKDIINFDFGAVDNKEYYDACIWSIYEEYLTEKQKQLTEQFDICKDIEQRKQISSKLYEITMQKKNKIIGEKL